MKKSEKWVLDAIKEQARQSKLAKEAEAMRNAERVMAVMMEEVEKRAAEHQELRKVRAAALRILEAKMLKRDKAKAKKENKPTAVQIWLGRA
jgi:hypothetical protein